MISKKLPLFLLATTVLLSFSLYTVVEHASKIDYNQVRRDIASILSRPGYDDGSIGPILVRLGWHTSGTYNKSDNTGGSNGATMRFEPERSDPANAGLDLARGFLEEIKQLHPDISYSDLWILAAYESIERLGGPHIEFRAGRTDAQSGSACPANGRLPDGSKNSTHIRTIFYRMGFNDQEIVALIGGGHAIGRCHRERSGYDGPWTDFPKNFTNLFFNEVLYTNWTVRNWTGLLQYEDPSHINMMMPTDLELRDDLVFRGFSEIYEKNQTIFFKDFAKAYKKLTELGFDH